MHTYILKILILDTIYNKERLKTEYNMYYIHLYYARVYFSGIVRAGIPNHTYIIHTNTHSCIHIAYILTYIPTCIHTVHTLYAISITLSADVTALVAIFRCDNKIHMQFIQDAVVVGAEQGIHVDVHSRRSARTKLESRQTW